MLLLVVSGTLCSPRTKLLGHKGDLTKDDSVYSSLLKEARMEERAKRATGDSASLPSALPEVLQSLGK